MQTKNVGHRFTSDEAKMARSIQEFRKAMDRAGKKLPVDHISLKRFEKRNVYLHCHDYNKNTLFSWMSSILLAILIGIFIGNLMAVFL